MKGLIEPKPIPTIGGVIPMRSSTFEVTMVGAVIVAALYFGQNIFIPLTLAILLTFILAPLVRALQRLRMPKWLAVLFVVTFAFGVIFGTGTIITRQVTDLAEELPKYQSTLKEKIKSLKGTAGGTGVIERASETLKSLQNELRKPGDDKAAPAAVLPTPTARAELTPEAEGERKPIPVEVHSPQPAPLDILQSIISVIVTPLATTGIVILFVVFILLRREDLRDRLIRVLGVHDFERSTTAIDDAGQRLSRYFLTLTGINIVFGVVIGTGLWLIGVPSPVLWGVLATLMRFVPFIGGFIAAAFPLLLAAAVDPGWSMVGWTLALYIVAEPLMAQVVEPVVQGQSTGLSPLAIILAAAFWTILWGPIGLLLAIPLTVVLVVLGRHVDRLEFLHILLGDTPPLSPAQSFYQRMLAEDSEEAAQQAEKFLKKGSLLTYYDDVVLEALTLAQNDADRGVLDPARLEDIKEATDVVIDIVSDLDTHVVPTEEEVEADGEDAEKAQADRPATRKVDAPEEPDIALPVLEEVAISPEWARENAVLCVAGRTALDEAAANVLASLLLKSGIGANVVTHTKTSPVHLRELNIEGVKLICVSMLDVKEKGAYTRFLVRRLKRAMPDTYILGAFWRMTSQDPNDRGLLAMIEVNGSAHSVREAYAKCLEMARVGHGDENASGALKSVAAA